MNRLQRHQLADAQAAGVEQLEHRAVAQAERRCRHRARRAAPRPALRSASWARAAAGAPSRASASGRRRRRRSRSAQRKKRLKTVRRRFALVAALPAWRASAYWRRSVSLASTSERPCSRPSQAAKSDRSRRYAARVLAARPSSIQIASTKRSIDAALAACTLLERELLRRDDLLVDLELGRDLRRELLRRVADDERAGLLDPLLDRRIVERLLHCVVDLVDDLLGQPLGSVDAVERHAG